MTEYFRSKFSKAMNCSVGDCYLSGHIIDLEILLKNLTLDRESALE